MPKHDVSSNVATPKTGGNWHSLTECPLCNCKRSCRQSADRSAIWCVNVASDRPKRGRGWIHRVNESSLFPWNSSSRPKFSPSTESTPSKSVRLRPFSHFERLSKEHAPKLERWAELRAVPVSSLISFGCVPESNSIVIPERSADGPGDVVGPVERYWAPKVHSDGTIQRFRFQRGARRGFQFIRNWKESKFRTVLIVEGWADVASALAGGFIAIGRPTRAANLAPLAGMLATREPWQTIFVLCENDEAKNGIDPRAEVEACAAKLSEAIGRRVVVVRCPPQFKDLNDFWRDEVRIRCDEIESLTGVRPKSHELSEQDYLDIGRKQLGYLRDQSDLEIVERNRERASKFKDRILEGAERERTSRRVNDDGEEQVDMDYDSGESCTYQRLFILPREADTRKNRAIIKNDRRINRELFVRQCDEKRKNSRAMGAKLACGKWKCPACRRRLLIPRWIIDVVVAFVGERGLFIQRVPISKLAAFKRYAQRHDGKYVLIYDRQRTEPDSKDEVMGEEKTVLAISSTPPLGEFEYLDFLDESNNHLFRFFDVVSLSVSSPDWRFAKRPVTSSHNFIERDKASVDDWKAGLENLLLRRMNSRKPAIKLKGVKPTMATTRRSPPQKTTRKKIRTRDPIFREPVFFGIVTPSTSAAIRAESYNAMKFIGHKPVDFAIFKTRDPDVEIAFCSSRFDGGTRLKRPLHCLSAIRLAFSSIGANCDEPPGDWIRACPRWTMKPTKGWEPTRYAAGPSSMRAIDQDGRMSRKLQELESGPTDSMVQASVLEVFPDEMQRFFSLLDNEKSKQSDAKEQFSYWIELLASTKLIRKSEKRKEQKMFDLDT